MKAIVLDGSSKLDPHYPDPKPSSNECLVRVLTAGICAADLQLIRGAAAFRGVPGHEFVGRVVQGPPELRDKRVACEINCVCSACDMCVAGLSNHCRRRTVIGLAGRNGCFAELIAVPTRNLHAIPDSVSDEDAVFVEPLAAAYQVLAQCKVEPRTTVSMVGSGRFGLLVAQVLATTGCKLSVVGRNSRKLELCEKRGIQTIHLDQLVPKQDRDVVVECSGLPDGLALAMKLVRPRGTIVLKSICAEPSAVNLSPLVTNEITLLGSRCGPFPQAIAALARQAVDVRSLISRVFPLDQGLEAIEAATRSENVKVLIKVGK